ncbi:MAG: Coenzyme F420 hydrogenase/dehydrogenase, beta subunit C-terminal domain [Planctomycetota bacterium]|nr:Coenzyme F420 hydrogenase/dehydrogenase, beta subunit C-terminal domain [Planctomycetota bacterium]
MDSQGSNILEIVDNHLCHGCGACAYLAPDQLKMVDTVAHGRRPSLAGESPEAASTAQVCSGAAWPERPKLATGGIAELDPVWGPVLEVWEGYSTDAEIRHRGSSGGAVTALALYGVEKGGQYGALHVQARRDAPLLNHAVLSRDRASLLAGAGSRYAPASPCEELGQIEQAPGPCVFIGKPCDVASTTRAMSLRPGLERNIGLRIAIFCAGTPANSGTVELVRKLGADDPARVDDIRYRGEGWPGEITASWKSPETGERVTRSISYADGWGNILQKHRQWRCQVCADHTGEHADLSVGDPWYRPVGPEEAGRSLILVRTERGRAWLQAAREAGYLEIERCEPWVLEASQKHLLRTQASVWGRSIALRLTGVSAPRFPGITLFSNWLKRLGVKEKAQSVWGTFTRVFRKRLRDSERARMLPDREITARESPETSSGSR